MLPKNEINTAININPIKQNEVNPTGVLTNKQATPSQSTVNMFSKLCRQVATPTLKILSKKCS